MAGIVASSAGTLEAIQHLNACKDRFKASILALKSAKIALSDPYLTEHFEKVLSKRARDVADTLTKMGLARLHLKQCYRRIPCFAVRPSKVSWTWANTRAITRISVNEAEKLLLKQGTDPGIILQLNKLAHLNYDEPLAILQTLAPHLRANLVFEEGNTIKQIGRAHV